MLQLRRIRRPFPREFSMNQFLKRFLFKLDSPPGLFSPPPPSIHGKVFAKIFEWIHSLLSGFFVPDIIKPPSFEFPLSSPSCPSREDVDNASTSQIDAKPRNCWTLDRPELNDERGRTASSVSCFIRSCTPVPCQSKEFFVVGRRFITVHRVNHLTDRSNEIYRRHIGCFSLPRFGRIERVFSGNKRRVVGWKIRILIKYWRQGENITANEWKMIWE